MTAADLDPHAARLLSMLAAGETALSTRQGPAERRQSLRSLSELAGDPVPENVVCETLHLFTADGAKLEVRRYTPRSENEGPSPALLYLHGGGWVAGDLETHAGVCGALAVAARCSVFALHYRQPPEHAFPGPIKDVLDALIWLRAQAEPLGVDGERLALVGDSAGANLAAAAVQDTQAPELRLLVLICPILDLARTSGSRAAFGRGYFIDGARLAADAQDYLQGASPCDPRVSPLLAPDLGRTPPTLIHAAACDPFRDEALDYAARLEAAGVQVTATVHPGMIHYFYALPRAIPYARTALAQIGAQVKAALQRAGTVRGGSPPP